MAPLRGVSAKRMRRGILTSVEELTAIEKQPGGVRNKEADGSYRNLTGEEMVSLNCWGFTLGLFDGLHRLFGEFLGPEPGGPQGGVLPAHRSQRPYPGRAGSGEGAADAVPLVWCNVSRGPRRRDQEHPGPGAHG